MLKCITHFADVLLSGLGNVEACQTELQETFLKTTNTRNDPKASNCTYCEANTNPL